MAREVVLPLSLDPTKLIFLEGPGVRPIEVSANVPLLAGCVYSEQQILQGLAAAMISEEVVYDPPANSRPVL